ncbi:ankyrin [Penicillium hispanicum]|uniref:ankyrin n=1 Tax=Penicillium hispanicum TaxID=1080232 RepID=UPI0025413218|nr:ankyrin [Penicillium hispanicum]KAJ5587039.1 ankyrin [Penicillium hispanicum]
MRVPIEILRQVLSDAVDILPIRDLMRIRLVNTFFADEISNLIDQKPRKLLRSRIQLHPYKKCMWSSIVCEMLDLQVDKDTIEEQAKGKEELIDKLIDAWLCGSEHEEPAMVDPDRYEDCMNWLWSSFLWERRISFEPIEETLQLALATSAIVRDDCTELQSLINQGVVLAHMSYRFGITPLAIAAKQGSSNVIKILVANGCGISCEMGASLWPQRTNILSVAAISGNIEALKLWIEHFRQTGWSFSVHVRPAIRAAARSGKAYMMEFLVNECGNECYRNRGEFPWLELLTQAVISGNLDTVEYILGREELKIESSRGLKGVLLTALQVTPFRKRTRIIELISAHGVDVNESFDGRRETPFQITIKKKDSESAVSLLRQGANVPDESIVPAFLLASQQNSCALAELLLERVSEKIYIWKGSGYVVKQGKRSLSSIENIMIQLGWDSEEVTEAHIDYYMVQHPLQ